MNKPKYDFTTEEFLRDPYRTFKQMRKHDPVYWSEQFNGWLVMDYDDVKLVTGNQELYENIWPYGAARPDVPMTYFQYINSNMLGFITGERTALHDMVRDAIQPLLSLHIFPEHQRLLKETMADLFRQAKKNGGMKFRQDFATPVCLPFFSDLLELSENMEYDKELWDILILDLVESFVHPYDPELLKKADASVEIVMDRISAVLLERRTNPNDGFISKFAKACPDGEIACPAILVGICIAAYNAVHLLCNAMATLLGHPREMDKLRGDSSLIDACTEEMMRYEGPLLASSRICRKDTKLREKFLREQDYVIAFLGSANRDEKIYENADCFDITREPITNFATGQGPRHCVAHGLARQLVRLMLQTMLEICPDIGTDVKELRWITKTSMLTMLREIDDFSVHFE
uniref:Cytochrome P450 n=1 Tax=Candidatus Kentrum sp. FW TaxID=2126338 RepID=A0A450TZ49_9GAMM|nr:MAG: Cytochrome P450 [Candidatus Kentron sp. FW]